MIDCNGFQRLMAESCVVFSDVSEDVKKPRNIFFLSFEMAKMIQVLGKGSGKFLFYQKQTQSQRVLKVQKRVAFFLLF